MKSFKSSILMVAMVLVAAFAAFGQRPYTQIQSSTSNMITTTYSSNQSNTKDFAIQAVVTVNTPSAVTFTCVASTDVCTSAANTFVTGLKGQGTTTTTLPGGLSTATDYFPIVLSSTTFKLASSLANALAGTAIDITSTGTGTHTFTPTAIAGASIKLQGSIDCVNFTDVASSSTNVTATANLMWSLTDQNYRCVRAASTLTAGMMKADIYYAPSAPQ